MCGKTFILTDKIEFFPDKDLERKLNFNFHTTRYVFNKTLKASIYRENLIKKFGINTKCKVNHTYTRKIVKNLKQRKSFLKNTEPNCLKTSTDHLIKAYNGFYEHRTRHPKFKSLKNNHVMPITFQNNNYHTKKSMESSIKWEENKIHLNKLGYIEVKHKHNIDGIIKEATIIKENGHGFLCIIYELEKIEPKEKFKEHRLYANIDVRLTDILTCSNDKVIPKPELKKINGRIQYYQQKLARQKKNETNRKKTLKKLQRWIEKKNNIINDYYHKLSNNIFKHWKFIAIETLNIRRMIQSLNLSKSIHKIRWSKLIEMIKYKAQWYGREFIPINRWLSSSKKYHICGKINHDLGCDERKWECPHYHSILQKDVNATKKYFRQRTTRRQFDGTMLSRIHT